MDHIKQLKDYYPEYIFKSSWPLEKDREANRKMVEATTYVSQQKGYQKRHTHGYKTKDKNGFSNQGNANSQETVVQ